MAENVIYKREEDLKNAKKVVMKYKERMNAEVRRQVGQGRRKRFQTRGVIQKIYSKDVIQVG